MAWRQFVMHLENLDGDAVEAVFEDFGAVSVTLTDAGDNPVLEPGPGETPLWQDTTITALFTVDTPIDGLQSALRRALHLDILPKHHVEDLEERVWEREWLKEFGPMQFGKRLWIHPKGHPQQSVDDVVIQLDPGLAFGTGTHATTALCLEWLDAQQLTGKTILDYGCGSGVLAIAGLKLGCSRATGMDIDPQAVLATRQNAADNAVAENLEVFGSADEICGKFDVVVANILAGPLIEFAESITSTLGERGILALSGVLCEQAEDVMGAFAPWIEFDDPVFREQDGQVWSRLTGKRCTHSAQIAR